MGDMLTTEGVKSLPKLQRQWLKRRRCGFCEISVLSPRCCGYSGEYELPVIEGVRDKAEIVALGPPCNMDERRAQCLAQYKPRAKRIVADSIRAGLDREGDGRG